MPTTINIPAKYGSRRLPIPHYWQPGNAAEDDYGEDFWPTLINVTGTVMVPHNGDTQSQVNTLLDLGIAASTSGLVKYGIRFQPFPPSDSYFAASNPTFDVENTDADADSIAYHVGVLNTRVGHLTAKGVTCSLVFVDCETFDLDNDATANQRAARTLKFQQLTDAMRAVLPNATYHWYARGWTIAQINTSGVLNSQYNYFAAAPTLNDPGDCTSTPLTMPQHLSGMQQSLARCGATPPHVAHDGVYERGPRSVVPWLGANRDAVDGVIGDYDQDYGEENAYAMGRWIAAGVRPQHAIFYPGPGLTNGGEYGTLNPYWWTHFNAYVSGFFDGYDANKGQPKLSISHIGPGL